MLRSNRPSIATIAAPVFAAGVFFIAPGCRMGPDYTRPEVAVPDGYRGADAMPDDASLADRPWWEVFDDPALVALIDEALANNFELSAAVARIEQARGVRAQVGSALAPQVGYGAAVTRGRNEFLGTPNPNGGTTATPIAATVTAFWEIDLWGRVRRADEAALANVLAAEEARRGVLLSVVSETAQLYFLLLGLDVQVEVARRNAESFGASRRLFQDRFEGGVDSELPVLRARGAEASVTSAVPQLERDIAIVENAINALLGRGPQPIERPRSLASQTPPPEIPVGVPSDLLARRPDVRAAEQRVVAANARVGAALADYLPSFSLTGALGRVSPELDAFSGGTGNLWSIGAGVFGPIFQGGRLKGQEAAARAAFDEAVALYRQSMVAALRDVADALVVREKLDAAEREQAIAVESLRRAVVMSTDRFLSGLSSYNEVLEAQQLLFPAEQALADTRTQRFVVLVQLYRALGGGWNLADDAWSSTSAADAAAETAP